MPVRILVPLVLLALLCATGPARAAVAEPPAGDAVEFEFEEIDGFEGELEEEECEEVEEGFEECEEAEEGEASDSRSSEACPLRSATARVVAHAEKRQLKLTIGYTTFEPTDATISFGKAQLRLGSTQRHLGKSGVVRLTESLSTSQTEKLNPNDRISVDLRVAGAPKDCKQVGRLSPRLVLH